MKRSALLVLLTFALTACGSSTPKEEGEGEPSKDSYDFNIKTSESLELTTASKIDVKAGALRELVPLFEDGHIDGFSCPVYGEANMSRKENNGWMEFNVGLTAKSSGELYFNIDSDAAGTIKNALRLELYQTSGNKSTIYSYDGGETVIESALDLNADGKMDTDPMTGKEIIYTTGVHSYNSEKFNTNPFLSLENNASIELRVMVFIDGFSTSNEDQLKPLTKLDLLFDLR